MQQVLLRALLDHLSRALQLAESVLLLAHQPDERQDERAHPHGGVEQELEDDARWRGFFVSAASMRQGCRQGVSPSVFPGIQNPQRSSQQDVRPKYDPRWITNRHRAAGASGVPAYGWPDFISPLR